MRFNYFSQNVGVDSKNPTKKQQNAFGFLDWIGNGKVSLLWQEYLPSTVNVTSKQS